MAKREKIVQFDWIRVIAMSGVIIAHVFSDGGISGELTHSQRVVYDIMLILLHFTIAAFVMISGALILPKEDDYKKTFARCKKMVLALFFFATPASVIENVMKMGVKPRAFLQAVLDVISGQSWDVFWYIYMVIGLYLIFPVLQRALKSMTLKQILCFCCVLYLFADLFPYLGLLAGGPIVGIDMPIKSVYVLYSVLGHVIVNVLTKEQFKKLVAPCVVYSLVYTAALSVSCIFDLPIKAFLALPAIYYIFCVAMFVVMYNYTKRESGLVTKLAECSFGIYLVHCFFLNAVFKFLHIYPANYPLIISVPLIFAAVFVLSAISIKLLMMIPFVRKHIL